MKDYDWGPRTILTYTLAVILAGSVIAAWLLYATSHNNPTAFQHLETIIGLIITPVFSLFSAAVGFYYGERRKDNGGTQPPKPPGNPIVNPEHPTT